MKVTAKIHPTFCAVFVGVIVTEENQNKNVLLVLIPIPPYLTVVDSENYLENT